MLDHAEGFAPHPQVKSLETHWRVWKKNENKNHSKGKEMFKERERERNREREII